ncbi:MAG TPA: hypothetical protein DEF45_06020 [Rhodopirellula sp.]|nr:hypothetical protein [Rhodopirellula sp.]
MATLWKPLPRQPLLVTSSEMNHFADDRGKQRRDQLVLKQNAALAPSGLWKTCNDVKRSMGG